jgi:hypothetical protein
MKKSARVPRTSPEIIEDGRALRPTRTTVTTERSPEWLGTVCREVQDLLKLPQGWNSYRARSIRPEIAAATEELLRNVAQANTPKPIVTPTVRGGIQLEWHTQGLDLEVECEAPDQFQVFFEDLRDNSVFEAELGLADMPRLSELVRGLARQLGIRSPGGQASDAH